MSEVKKAYSLFEVKSVDADKRVFEGIATTPTPDRTNDIVQPLGVSFKNPLPLLHQHDHSQPVGLVEFDRPTEKGIKFRAEIPNIPEPGALRDRVEMAWQEIKYGLVRAVSIGFRPIKYAFMDNLGIDYQEIEVYELSMVTVPANADAVISAVKSMHASPEVIEQIKKFDHYSRRTEPIKLIKPEAQKQITGAVKLLHR
jgi:HK97 family phage prohead protease